MLTIIWNPNGFRVTNVLSTGIRFNTGHYITDLLIALAEWPKTQVGRTDRKLIVRADNAHPYFAKMSLDFLEQNGMRKARRPPYSPDVAPSDFCLFGHVTQLLAGYKFLDPGALLDAIQDISRGIKELH